METEQLNIRVNKELLKDLDVISKFLKVNKSEWIKIRLAKEVLEEKNKLLMDLSTLYAKGMIDKSELENMVGKNIADEMEFIKNKAKDSVRSGVEDGKKLREELKKR